MIKNLNMKNVILSRCLVLAAVLASLPAFAANPENVTVTATVPTVAILSVDTNSVAISFAAGDYDLSTGAASKTASAGSTFRVSTNRSWTLSAKAGSANFSYTPTNVGDTSTKPAGDLGFKLSTAGSYTTLTTSDQTLATGTRGGYSTVGNTRIVDYSLSSNLNQDSPGSYSLTVVYTLTSS
ncbi:MAG: hypothetical protein ABIQ12_02025 [Opitutaceae bacterium]